MSDRTEFRVVEVNISGLNYAGPCPTTLNFSGEITVSGKTGIVKYQWFRSDGIFSEIYELNFPPLSPRSQVIPPYNWEFSDSFSGSIGLRITYPNLFEDTTIDVMVTCNAI